MQRSPLQASMTPNKYPGHGDKGDNVSVRNLHPEKIGRLVMAEGILEMDPLLALWENWEIHEWEALMDYHGAADYDEIFEYLNRRPFHQHLEFPERH